MKNKNLIVGVIIILVVILTGYLLFFSEKSPVLTKEEILTAGTNELGKLTPISVPTKEKLFDEIEDAVNKHLERE